MHHPDTVDHAVMLWRESNKYPLTLISPVFAFFRVVKEEISDDGAKLPCFNGRVVSWVRHDKPARFKFNSFPQTPYIFCFLRAYKVGEAVIRPLLLFNNEYFRTLDFCLKSQQTS